MDQDESMRVAKAVQQAAINQAQWCRENGESDMRSVIGGIRGLNLRAISDAAVSGDPAAIAKAVKVQTDEDEDAD